MSNRDTLLNEFQHPLTKDQQVWWAAMWEKQQEWRTEAEIDERRQVELKRRLAVEPDIERGIYPFKGMKLSRADVEWLLVQENEQGSTDGKQERRRLDLRGADLAHVNLSHLPLTYMCGSLSLDEGLHATAEQGEAASVDLTYADLTGAHLEMADLSGAKLDHALLLEAHLTGADLGMASLKQAILVGAHCESVIFTSAIIEQGLLIDVHLERANLRGAVLSGSNLLSAHLEGARMHGAYLENANLSYVHLEGKEMSREDLARIRTWQPNFPGKIPAADLRDAYFNLTTQLNKANLGDKTYGFIAAADLHWNNVNLSVIKWRQVEQLGDEYWLTHNLQRDFSQDDMDEGTRNERIRQRLTYQAALLRRAGGVSDAVMEYVERSASLRNKVSSGSVQGLRDAAITAQQGGREQYQQAVRANRQLMVALQVQGLSEEAAYFGYRAQVLQRRVLKMSGLKSLGPYLFSLFLDKLAGYGYRPQRTLVIYLVMIFLFACVYFSVGFYLGPHIPVVTSLVLSVTAFHGRGLVPSGILLSVPMTILGAVEAVIGLVIEISFIATFTRRFFGN